MEPSLPPLLPPFAPTVYGTEWNIQVARIILEGVPQTDTSKCVSCIIHFSLELRAPLVPAFLGNNEPHPTAVYTNGTAGYYEIQRNI